MSRKLLDLRELKLKLGGEPPLSNATIYRRIKDKKLPPAIKIFGSGTSRWADDEIDACIDRQAAERRLPR